MKTKDQISKNQAVVAYILKKSAAMVGLYTPL